MLSGPLFVDVAKEVGVDFRHYTGARGDYYLQELMGPGCALFDYDNDGDLDLYVVQGNVVEDGKPITESVFAVPAELPPRNRLYRNELAVDVSGKRTLRFTDVTTPAGVGHTGNGMGCAVGDVDADGYLDLYVTNDGPNVLYRNNGDGTFADVTAEAGVDDRRWNTSAAFVDYDLDGDLDLFVVAYCDSGVDKNPPCFQSVRDYCPPSVFDALKDRLFRNEGNGRFTDVTGSAGIGAAHGSGLGVAGADLNGDGLPDIYVANDGNANQLWINQGDGTFVDAALEAGVAFNGDGMPEAGMGIALGDFDQDGDDDLFLTHVTGETNTLYVNDGDGFFVDDTAVWNLGNVSRPMTSFGTYWIDLDNDSRFDLVAANGAVHVIEADLQQPYPFGMGNQVFHNVGGGRFEDVSAAAGPSFLLAEVSRALAAGDLDNDGDVDAVITNNNGPVYVLLNVVKPRGHFVRFRVVQGDPPVDAVGARVEVIRDGGAPLAARVHSDGSYCSANDLRVHFGLGDQPRVRSARVRWPDGAVEEWSPLRIDSLTTLARGSGVSVK